MGYSAHLPKKSVLSRTGKEPTLLHRGLDIIMTMNGDKRNHRDNWKKPPIEHFIVSGSLSFEDIGKAVSLHLKRLP